MHVHIVLRCGAKTVLFTNKLSECWCCIIIPYLFTKFHTSKHFGKRVTQSCMPYCNVWAEVVYCGFPKSMVFTKTLICLFPARHQSLYLHQVSYVGYKMGSFGLWERCQILFLNCSSRPPPPMHLSTYHIKEKWKMC